MMRTVFRVFALLMAFTLLASSAGFAGGNDRVGTSSAPQLLIPVGARGLAMGGAMTATATGVEAIYWNPAGLARSDAAATAMFTHMGYIADMSVNTVAVDANLGGFGHLGFGLKAMSIGDIEVTTADNPDGTGMMFSPSFFTLGVTYAKGLTDNVSFGVNVNLVHEEIKRVGASTLAVDVGVQYVNFAGINGLSFGMALRNLGGNMTYDGSGLTGQGKMDDGARPSTSLKVDPASFELPSALEIGLAYTHDFGEMGTITGSYMFQNNNFSFDDNKMGLEYSFRNMVFLRGGYTMGMDVPDGWDYIYGPSFGAGFHKDMGGIDLTLDYAYRFVEVFDSNQMFTVKIGF